MNPQPKQKRLRDKKYLAWLQKQQPLIMGVGDTVCHHIRLFGGAGMGIKAPDNDCIPISDSIHQKIHSSGRNGGEKNVLINQHKFTIDILRDLCDAYYREYCRHTGRKVKKW